MASKICPLMSRLNPDVGVYGQAEGQMHYENCQEENCQLWTTAYTAEGNCHKGCALTINARRNLNGHCIGPF